MGGCSPPQEEKRESRSEGGPRGGAAALHAAVTHVLYALRMRQFRDLFSRPAVVSCQSPAWLLGVCYEAPFGDSTGDEEALARFQRDFESRLWFTYRRDFEALGDSNLTSDVGWGCMLRSGQMLLAQALINDRLGRSWRWNNEELGPEYLEIVNSFGDAPTRPFSIHHLIAVGSKYGLCAGEWLGPYVLCRTLEALADSSNPASNLLRMAVHVVAGDGKRESGGAPMLCVDDVVELCIRRSAGPEDAQQIGASNPGNSWHPVLILIPLMLGHDKINPRYLQSLRAVFEFPQSLGVVGGKPGGAMYLVGTQEEQLLYLDPHQVQSTSLIPENSDQQGLDTSSYHCRVPRKMPLEAMDPSLALGFYCKTEDEFQDLCVRSIELAERSTGAPMFTIGRREDWQTGGVSESQENPYEEDKESSSHGEDDWQIV